MLVCEGAYGCGTSPGVIHGAFTRGDTHVETRSLSDTRRGGDWVTRSGTNLSRYGSRPVRHTLPSSRPERNLERRHRGPPATTGIGGHTGIPPPEWEVLSRRTREPDIPTDSGSRVTPESFDHLSNRSNRHEAWSVGSRPTVCTSTTRTLPVTSPSSTGGGGNRGRVHTCVAVRT